MTSVARLFRSLPACSSTLAIAAATAISLVASPALAQDPVLPAPPAPMTAASSGSEGALTVGLYTCAVGEHAGVDGDDAHTAADVVCHALATHSASPGAYDIRVGKLGGKLLFAITQRATGAERRLFIQGIEEVPVASDRLILALVQGKPIEESVGVDTVVSSESVTPKQKNVQPGVILGLTGQSGVGQPNSMSAGVEIDMQFRLHNLALLGEGRAGGIGSGDNTLGYASLGLGARYFLSDAETAPFVGGGLMFGYFQQNEGNGNNANGSGFGAYGEVGLAFLRSSHVGGVIDLRVDLPTYKLNQSYGYEEDGSGVSSSAPSASVYVVPLSLNVGMSFQ
jgi:hypothetical protein